MNEAKHYEKINYHFNLMTKDVDLQDNTLVMQNLDNEVITFGFDKLFACDGAFSAIRARLQQAPEFNYSQEFSDHGYKELEIPAKSDGTHQLRNDCLHIWPRGEFMMIALPNLDGSFTCTLFFPMQGELSFESLNTADKVMVFFQDYFPDTLKLIPDLETDFFENPVGGLVTVKCDPWQANDDVLLMGDAAHAIVPFYGQGMNAGFEDCTVFSNMYDDAKGSWDGLLKSFSETRFKDGHAIADLALYNYIEMRDKTADPDFLLRKKIESKFTRLYPDKWMPLYSLVTFSHTPYHKALESGVKQRTMMDEVMSDPKIHENWDSEVTMTKILRLLEKAQQHA
jgi:kynurenine 3-monooxygenase